MKSFIRIARVPYEEPYHLNLIVTASNGRTTSQIEIYAATDDLKAFAEQLRRFPKQEAVWGIGSELSEDGFQSYFRLRAFQIAPGGRSAIEVRFTSNEPVPDRETAEFSIEAVPSDLDRFADLLERFAQLEHQTLEWCVTEGHLG